MTAVSFSGRAAVRLAASDQDRILWRLVRRTLKYVIIFAVGILLTVLFQQGRYLPTRLSVALLMVLAAVGMLRCRFAPLSPLTRLMIALYAMPFAACIGYLWSDDYLWWDAALAAHYMSDPVTIQIMTMTGLIGLCGLLIGYVLAADARRPVVAGLPSTRTLKPIPFTVALLAALFFSYINTPPDTIFSNVYSAATGVAGLINFNAAYLVAYTLLIMLIVDAEQERSRPLMRTVKRVAVVAVTVFIVVFFQILRGDRDSFGCLVGLAALFVTEPLPATVERRIRRRRVAMLGVSGLVVLTVFISLGEVRNRLALRERVRIREAVISGLTTQSTATAVLLTNLSLARSYRFGEMPVEGGLTYRQYVLSLPPGFVTRALGVERPLENYRGPNFWFTDISAGGVHVVTVPFRNLLAPGAFLILIVCGYLIGRSEIAGQHPRWTRRLWYGSMFVVSAHWFWYGDIVFIREVMSFAIAAGIYAVVRRIGALSLRPHEQPSR